MRTGFNAMRALLPIAVLGISMSGSAMAASTTQLTFYTLSAPHSAIGVPMQYRAAVTNKGTATVTGLTLTVVLTAPDTTAYTLLNSKVNNLTPGQISKSDNYFTTSTLTSQTGNFTLTATLSATSVIATQSIPLTVVPDPSNGVYVSIGGMGPASAVLGTTTDYQVITANLGASTQKLTTNTTLTRPNNTTVVLLNGTPVSIGAKQNSIGSVPFNTADFDLQTGSFKVTATVLDSSNNVVATDTYTFTRTAVPANKFVPTFTESAMASGVGMARMMTMDDMNMMNGMCNPTTNNDYMMGGGGIGVGDYDGDGFDDMYVSDMMGMGHLYHNNGNGTFTEMTMEAMIPMVMGQSGAIFADFDNDGHPDLLIFSNNMGDMMGMMTQPSVLLHNNGNGTFSDVTATSGLPMTMQNITGATAGDYDGDGFLDLYLTAHVDCMGMNANDHLLHNNGNGTFSDVTYLLGSGSTDPRINRRGVVAAFVDYNGDGRPDLYVGNDEGSKYGGNVLWRNDGPGGSNGWIFTDVSSATGAGATVSDMGIAFLDYTHSGNISMLNTNVGQNVFLQYSPTNAKFTQVQDDNIGDAHIARKYIPDARNGQVGLFGLPLGWGVGAYDFNNDGWEDIFEAGGGLAGMAIWNNNYFQNNGDGTFMDATLMTGTAGFPNMMPGAVVADFNNDGFMDVYEISMIMEQPPLYFVNNARANANPYNWLEVKLTGGCTPTGGCAGVHSNKDGVGAKVVATVGTSNMTRWVVDGATYQSNNTLVQHFGLLKATKVDTLTIYWPSGKVQTLTNVAANQKLTVSEP